MSEYRKAHPVDGDDDTAKRKRISSTQLVSIPRTPSETSLTDVSSQPIIEANQEADKSSALAQTPSEMPSITPYRQDAILIKSYSPSRVDVVKMQEIQEGCRQLCLPLFYQERVQVRSLGFTSALAGEGKTFLATVAAHVLANDIGYPITLVECNWEHPALNKQFGLPPTPGLAEWLCGECSELSIRHQVSHNLTIVLAGSGKRRAVKLLHQMLQRGLRSLQLHPDELFIVDVLCIIRTTYGSLASNVADSLVIVVKSEVRPEAIVVETCEEGKGLARTGVVPNRSQS